MAQYFYKMIWELSELTGIGLGRFAPYVFQQMIGGYEMKKKPDAGEGGGG